MLNDQVGEWLLGVEKFSLPFVRFADFSRISHIALDLEHVTRLLKERTAAFCGATPVRMAFYGEQPPAFGIAQLWEALFEETAMEASAFRNHAAAASWLNVPADILD